LSLFRQLRILVLLLILLLVAAGTWLSQWRTTDWDTPLVVALYPIVGDDSAKTQDFVRALSVDDFVDIETLFQEEANEYGLSLTQPVDVVLGPVLDQSPPAPPTERSLLATVWWSLNMRYWGWQVAREYGPPADIQIFVLFHDPALRSRLQHSLGLRKGLLGVVHAFADLRQVGTNNVIIAHEFLHTLGASDKYDPRTSLPLYPAGYAEPQRVPLFPQRYAEIMGGRIPQSKNTAVQPRGFSEVLVGESTAREIRWIP